MIFFVPLTPAILRKRLQISPGALILLRRPSQHLATERAVEQFKVLCYPAAYPVLRVSLV